MRLGLVVVALAALAGTARAHQSSVVYSDIAVDGRDIDYTLRIASTDLYEAVGVDRDRPVTVDEVRAGKDRLARYVAARIHITGNGGIECAPSPRGVDIEDGNAGFFAVVKLAYRCPRSFPEATVRYDLFFDVDPRHQGIAHVSFADTSDTEREQVFRDSSRTLVLRRNITILDHVVDYLVLGIEHIFTGYDHIAFLFGLLVVAGALGLRRGAREVLGIVTAFTVAHSVTLISSALGWIAISSRLVEPAIALSIAYVGVENLVNPRPRHRWLLTFTFGLIHGFGFASVLKEIGLPEKGLLVSLVSFNVGVEIGQLAVVATVLPLLALLAAEGAGLLQRSNPAAALAAGGSPSPKSERSLAFLGAAVLAGGAATFALFSHFGVARVQLAVLCFAVPPLALVAARRWGYDRVVRVVGSATITLLATFWFFERVLGRVLFGGQLG